MNRKFLMVFLIVCFLAGLFALVIFYSKNRSSMTTSLPYLRPNPFPASSEPTATPTIIDPSIIDPYVQKGRDLLNDFKKIEEDVEKVKKNDTRLTPPDFYFELQVSE